MSNDAQPIRLTKTGCVTIAASGITVEGFEGENCSCRDVVILACLWAIGELQRVTMENIEVPGGNGNVALG